MDGTSMKKYTVLIAALCLSAAIAKQPVTPAKQAPKEPVALKSDTTSVKNSQGGSQPKLHAQQEAVGLKTDVPSAKEVNAQLVDEIAVIIYGTERKTVISKSELERLSIDGRKRNIDDLIIEELMYQDALRYKIPVDEEVVDKYIFSIQKQHGITLNDVKEIFRSSGYTYEEGRDQLRMMYAVNSMLEVKINSRLFVSKKEVEAYYNEHPEYDEARFQFQTVLLPYSYSTPRDKQRASIMQAVNAGKLSKQYSWSDPFWLNASEIAEDRQFLTLLPEGGCSEPQEVGGGFELFKLLKKEDEHLTPLARRYRMIVEELRQPKFQQKLEEYRLDLLKNATVVYLDEKYKSKG